MVCTHQLWGLVSGACVVARASCRHTQSCGGPDPAGKARANCGYTDRHVFLWLQHLLTGACAAVETGKEVRPRVCRCTAGGVGFRLACRSVMEGRANLGIHTAVGAMAVSVHFCGLHISSQVCTSSCFSRGQ